MNENYNNRKNGEQDILYCDKCACAGKPTRKSRGN